MRHEHCKECGRVFQSTIGQKMCSPCRDRYERAFRAAKEVLLENPNASFKEIVRETSIDIDLIKRLSKEGMIHVLNASDGAIECERCEREVRGMLSDMSNAFTNTVESPQLPKTKVGFHSRQK